MNTLVSSVSGQPAFDRLDFVARFANRRDAVDSVNRLLDEPALLALAGPLHGQKILEIGCGLGDLAVKMAGLGASGIVAIDSSRAMIEQARERIASPVIQFKLAAVENLPIEEGFDLAVSAMVVHFIDNLDKFLDSVRALLKADGAFIFSQRHPIRTSNPVCQGEGSDGGWKIDKYFDEGWRDYEWLGESIKLYHRTVTTIINSLQRARFEVDTVIEPKPNVEQIRSSKLMREAHTVPMLLTIKAIKRS